MLEHRGATPGLTPQPACCSKCEQLVTLHVLEQKLIDLLRPVHWFCPSFTAHNMSEVKGRLGLVSRGQPDSDPERPPDVLDLQRHISIANRIVCPQCQLPPSQVLKFPNENPRLCYYLCASCYHV